MDRRARQPRDLQPRRAGLVAASSTRGRSPRRRTASTPADDGVGNYSEPYAVPLGGGARVVVFDSSNAGNNPIPVDGPTYRTYKAQLAQALAPAAPAGGTLFAVHHPPLAFAANNDRPGSPYPGNAALQATLSPLFGDALFPPAVGAVVSGHIHAFEAVTFTSGQPPQFVFGDGGTAADSPLPDPFPAGLAPAAGAVVAELLYTNRFGFATLDRAPGGWTLHAYGVTGTPMTTCTLRGRDAACTPIARSEDEISTARSGCRAAAACPSCTASTSRRAPTRASPPRRPCRDLP